jgi:hypothetical protein
MRLSLWKRYLPFLSMVKLFLKREDVKFLALKCHKKIGASSIKSLDYSVFDYSTLTQKVTF